jgi:hypothetical protein
MPKSLVRPAVWAAGLTAVLSFVAFTNWGFTMAADAKAEPHIVHNVFFALNDNSAAGKQKLVDACKTYLTNHEGTVYFSAGVVSDKLTRPVNDREWDVGLHIVFKTMADHDRYQDHPRHTKFIDENKASWKKVRVFDSEVLP